MILSSGLDHFCRSQAFSKRHAHSTTDEIVTSANLKADSLPQVEEMLRHDWFHGDVTTAEAERMLLTSNQPGTFLVRFSSQPGAFTVSSLSRDRTIKMFRITRKGTEFCFGDHTFASLAELLAKMRDQLRAYYPCPNSKYRYIFDPKPSGLAQYMAP